MLLQTHCVRKQRHRRAGSEHWRITAAGGLESILHLPGVHFSRVVRRRISVLHYRYSADVVVRYNELYSANAKGMCVCTPKKKPLITFNKF